MPTTPAANTRPWLVFYGTQTTIVVAGTKRAAFTAFVARLAPDHGKQGRLMPPTRDEVTIRRATEADRGWIEDSGNREFMALLPKRRRVSS